MRGVRDTAIAFDRACRRAGLRYVFVGGVAVMTWGQPRATTDVDSLLALDADEVDRFVDALRKEGLASSRQDFLDALEDRSHVSVFDAESAFHVDVKLARTSEERREIEEGVDLSLGQDRIRVARPEDVVAFKISFGSPQDLQDARSILQRQAGQLDLERMAQAAARLGVADRLKELLGQA